MCEALGPMPSTTDTNKRKKKSGVGDREAADDIEAGGPLFHVNLGYGGRLQTKPNNTATDEDTGIDSETSLQAGTEPDCYATSLHTQSHTFLLVSLENGQTFINY